MGDALNEAANLRAWRRAQRERLVAERLVMPAEVHAAACAAVTAAIVARFALPSLGRVGGYWPIRQEYDCLPLLRAAASAALPVAIAPKQPLEFRPWTPEARMERGDWDISHPAEGSAVVPDTLLVPLVGFDAGGHRLGYGGGYYDRTLAALTPRPITIGVGFELGRLESVRPQPHDIPMDYIVTEAGLFASAPGTRRS